MISRRTFLGASATATFASITRFPVKTGDDISRTRAAMMPGGSLPRGTDPELRALSLRALDAATRAGATYADVRFTMTRRRTFHNDDPAIDLEELAVGVRALANGAWGFAAARDWTPDAVARLAQQAVAYAKTTSWPNVPPIKLDDRLPSATGHWQTPVSRDPFAVPLHETTAVLADLMAFGPVFGQLGIPLTVVVRFERQDRTFASTDGSYVTQAVYTAFGGSPHDEIAPSGVRLGSYQVPTMTPVGGGYEQFEAALNPQHLDEQATAWSHDAIAVLRAKPAQLLGQYDVVLDATAMAALVDATVGAAVEYDRVIGDDVDTEGSSYLAPPAALLGKRIAAPSLTVTGDRTMPGGVATVQWDDDGVTPHPTSLIQEGHLVDYATTREFAPDLAAWYHTRSRPVRSNGCSASESAFTRPLVCSPNLIVHPGAAETSMDALLSGITTGVAIFGGSVTMSPSQQTGQGNGARTYLVQNGKLGASVKDAAYTFRTLDLWKDLVVLGGSQTAAQCGMGRSKGEPNQSVPYSISAVAARFQRMQMLPIGAAR